MAKFVSPKGNKDKSLDSYVNFIFNRVGEDEDINLAFNGDE